MELFDTYFTYYILVEHNLYIDHYRTQTAYIVVANLASWDEAMQTVTALTL